MLVWMALAQMDNSDDAAVLGDIYTAYAARVYQYIRRKFPNLSETDIEDAVSETFLKMIQKKDKFIPYNDQIRVQRLIVYARCECLNLCRKHKTDVQFLLDWSLFENEDSDGTGIDEIASEINIEETFVNDAFDRILYLHAQELMKKLSSPAYEIMMLKIDQQCTSFEIGKILHMHAGTVRTIYRRTCEKIKRELVKKYGNQ